MNDLRDRLRDLTDRRDRASVVGVAVTATWLLLVVLFWLFGPDGTPQGGLARLASVVGVLLPPVLIWAWAAGNLTDAWRTKNIWLHISRSTIGIAAMAMSFIALADLPLADAGALVSRWWMLLEVEDRPGVLADVARIFADAGVSVEALRQATADDGATATLEIGTHAARERQVRGLVAGLTELPSIVQVRGLIRHID